MSRTRSFILLASSFLLASSAWADDLGFVDCSAHPETTQVFGKPRQTPDSVATVACGERFTILLNGFIFSRVQTKDGKVGYVYSSLITVDHGQAGPAPSAAARPAASVPAAAPASNPHPAVANAATVNPAYAQPTSGSQAAGMPVTTSPAPEKPAAPAGPLFPTPPMPAVTAADVHYSSSAQAAPAASSSPAAQASAPASSPAASAQVAAAAPSQPAAPAPAAVNSQADAVKPASAPATPSGPNSASITPTVTASTPAPAPAAPSADPKPAAPAPSQPSAPAPAPAAVDPQPSSSSSSSASAQSSAPAQPGPLFPTTPPPAPAPPASSTPDSAPAPAAADPAPASQPQPEAAAPPAPQPVRSVRARESWEQPVAGAHQSFLLELYSGYAFARFVNAGTSANLAGGLGSFGWNLKPWLQIVGDSSYNFATATGAKTVLYGNHFGARYYYHSSRFGMGRFGLTPFVEALAGGSRLDTTVTGPGGFKTSVNCISYKAGGGLDFHFSPHWEVRLINVDYYRTTLGAAGTPAQNNYWASAGVVLRLFGARSE